MEEKIKAQAKRIEELEGEVGKHLRIALKQNRAVTVLVNDNTALSVQNAELKDENTHRAGRIDFMGLKIQLQADRITELKQENTTLRATAELVETALRDYVLAQSRMSERWAESDKAVKHQLWRDLHVCEALGREALEALEQASATHPTANPDSSEGSGTMTTG